MHSHKLKSRKEQGQAMVEFAILMIVLIPLLVWGFYFQDVGHHMLDLQETVLSTTWDYAGRTSQASDSTSDAATFAAVYHANRFEYIDHTSAYDDFGNLKSSSDESKYHFELGSRAAWVTKSGSGADELDMSQYASDYQSDQSRQVVCGVSHDDDLGWLTGGMGGLGGLNPAQHFGSQAKYNKGGLVTCWAKLFIYNYVIPEKFMQEHAHEDLAMSDTNSANDRKFNQRSTDVESLDNARKPLILRDHAAISVGTWAINNGDASASGDPPDEKSDSAGDLAYCPDNSNPFYERVAWVYSGGGLSGSGLSADAIGLNYKANVSVEGISFMTKARSNDLESAFAIPIIPGSTDGSPQGYGLCGSWAKYSAEPLGHNIIGANLVARHDRKNGKTESEAPLMLDIAYFAGPKFESSPWSDGSGQFKQAWENRGHYYMGNTKAEQ